MKAFRIGLYGCGCRTRQVLERALKSGMAKVTLCHDIDCGKAGELAGKYHAESTDSTERLYIAAGLGNRLR